jgi:flagellar basal-body rod protein FlgB
MIKGITNAGAIPVLERTMQFAAQRHGILANNIANLSTPGFRPADVSVANFQEHLAEAIYQRRTAHGNTGGDLPLEDTADIAFERDRLTLKPEPIGDNILFHDGNDRNVERIMQGLVENFMAFRVAAQFIRREFDSLNTAIRERL